MLSFNTVWVYKYINYLNILTQPFHQNDLTKFDCDDKNSVAKQLPQQPVTAIKKFFPEQLSCCDDPSNSFI